MKIKTKNKRWKLYIAIRSRYQFKRHQRTRIGRKRKTMLVHHHKAVAANKQLNKPYIDHEAPKNFSFVKYPNIVLKYFEEAEKKLKQRENINLDISKVEEFTSDTIALLVANVNDKDFHHERGLIKGNSPENPELKKLFTQSGFGNFVRSRGFNSNSEGNLLHREKHHKVVPEIAMKASLNGIKHTFENATPFEPLYDILIECMSNTNNHGNPKADGKCYWWLYVYNEPQTKITTYSFLDLGVGIFESVIVKNYIKKFLKGSVLYKNINLVDELLAGKIQSRIENDKEIRGKGIPQIVNHAKLNNFKEFYLITNDVSINIKTGLKEQLNYNLSGTFYYWELQPS